MTIRAGNISQKLGGMVNQGVTSAGITRIITAINQDQFISAVIAVHNFVLPVGLYLKGLKFRFLIGSLQSN